MEICALPFVVLLCTLLTGVSVSSEWDNDMSGESNVAVKGKSLVQYARGKIANLISMRDQLQKLRSRQSPIDDNFKNVSFHDGSTTVGSQFENEENATPRSAPTFVSIQQQRNRMLSKLLPNTDILRKLARMRETLEPNLRNFLTSKYNDFLTNLVPYSDSIGVPPFMLNSMKIPENFDPRWNYIQNLLETSSLEQFLNSLPDMSSLRSLTEPIKVLVPDRIQSRSDDDFISDQEPQATSKGKKKYGTLRLPTRVKVYRKGDSGSPERAAYEYAGFGDQYGLYSQNSYDASYGKGYDDYSVAKGYDEYPSKGGKYVGLYDQSVAAGHNSYSSHGHGGGYGSYASNMGSYMDPFSILGGLAFLTYLGLLFQQSLNMTAGRSYTDSVLFNRFDKPIELPLLNFGSREMKSLDFTFRTRKGRAQEDDENLEEAVTLVETLWRDIHGLKDIDDKECKHQKLCQVIKNLENRNLLPVFIDELEKQEMDRKFLYDMLNQVHESGLSFDCHLKVTCQGQ